MTKLTDIQWNVLDIQGINYLHDMHLPAVTMNLKYDDRIANQSKSISFSLNAEQFSVLLAGMIMLLLQSDLLYHLDLQTARDVIKTYSKS